MDRLRVELGTALGEPLSRMEQIREYAYAHLYRLYNQQGNALPVIAKTYVCAGLAQQEAYKLSLLAREGIARLPTVYGVITLPESILTDTTRTQPYQELLLLERLPGVYVDELPTEVMPDRFLLEQRFLMEQIVDALLAWHRLDSRGWAGIVDACQESSWVNWYQRYLISLWQEVRQQERTPFTSTEYRILVRSLEQFSELFADFDDNTVLVHGNLTLRSILKDEVTQQLVAIINPGVMLWAPREYELFRLGAQGVSAQLLGCYLKRAPIAESFMARRWLYLAWELIARFLRVGQLDETFFRQACDQLVPWLDE